ncbi:MAG: tetratricopeptide repeat protein [Sedimentisphaerales bacterium]
MSTKTLLITSVLFGFLLSAAAGLCFASASAQLEQAESYYEAGDYPKAEQVYQDILKQHAGSDFAFQAQKKLTILYIAWGKKPQAEAAFQELANLSVSADITAAIKDMASYYRRLKKHEEPDKRFQYYQALSICRRQLDVVDQPGDEYAMWSQVRLAMSNIEVDDAAAQAAIDKLVTEFFDNSQIARGVHEVALKYRVLKKYEEAIEFYQYVVDNWPAADYTAWSQMDLAKSYVAIGDDPNAEAAVKKLLANYSNNPSIAQIVYDMASCYRQAKKHPKAISLYQHIIDNWPQQKYAMWSLRDLAMSNVDRGDDPNAQAAVDKLIADYSDHVHIPWNLYEIAKYYRDRAKYERAINLYQYILNHWPTADHAIWSQLDTAMSYATIGDDPNAVAAIDKLVTRFPKNPHIAGVVYEMAKSYRRSKKDEKANQICHLVIDNWPKGEHAMLAQADLIKSYLALGNNAAAEAGVDKLLADFSKQGRIAQAVYDIAKQYHTLQKYEKASLLYQHVIDKYPDDKFMILSHVGIAGINIDLGDDAAAQAVIDTLIADFNDHPDLPEAVFVIGEQYYYKAFEDPNKCRRVKSEENLFKAKDIWERIITQCPESQSIGLKHAQYFTAVCYRRFGEYEKAITHYQKVVDNWPDYQYAWSAQYLIGSCYEKLKNLRSLPESEAYPKIEQAYKAVVEKYPDSAMVPSASLKLGYLNLKRDQKIEAAQYFALFLATARPNDPRIESVEIQLEELKGEEL